MTNNNKQNYLVWEGQEIPVQQTFRGAMPEGTQLKTVTEFNTVPFAVAAKTDHEACMVVMRKTRRISKYAVCPVSVIDFTQVLDDTEPKGEPGLLTTSGNGK